jgi:LacI family transcriptional regulator
MVKLKDIADKANVTISTVSAALNGTGRISKTRQDKIKALANELGYHPNLAGKLLKTGAKNRIGLIIHDKIENIEGHGVYSVIISNCLQECYAMDLDVDFEIYSDENDIPKTLKNGLVTACIYCGYIPSVIKEWLEKNSTIPVVVFGELWDYSVISNISSGIYNAVQYLIATQHTKIHFICGPTKYYGYTQAMKGFKLATKEFGVTDTEKSIYIQTKVATKDENKENISFLDDIIKRRPKNNALILSGRHLTTLAIYYFQRNNIRIPEDLSIVGLMSNWEAKSIFPGITAIEPNIKLMTKLTLDMLMQRIKNKKIKEPNLYVNSEFVKRHTVVFRD